jgi:hypothetical protein
MRQAGLRSVRAYRSTETLAATAVLGRNGEWPF